MSVTLKNDAVGVPAVGRIELKLRQTLDAGQFYEAHQLYRTLYFRYCAQHKFAPLLDLLYEGARCLLEVAGSGGLECAASGADLATLYVDVLAKSQLPVDGPSIDRLSVLYEAILAPTVAAKDDEKSGEEDSAKKSILLLSQKFVHDAMKWSNSAAPKIYLSGHPLLHSKFARILWACKEFEQARRHFLLSDDGQELALFLVDYHSNRGLTDEVDLFIAQAVLQLLCRNKFSIAQNVFFHYIQRHPLFRENTNKKPPFATPLIDFLYLLLQSIENHATVQSFTVLVDKFEGSLLRDRSYAKYLDKIGQNFFGLPPPTNAGVGQNFLTNLIRDLMKDDEEEEHSGNDANAAVTQGGCSSRSQIVSNGPALKVPNEIGVKANFIKENAQGLKQPAAKEMQHEEELD